MKKIILLLVCALSSFANDKTFYYLGGYEDTFKKEISNNKKSQELIKKAMLNKDFKKAYKMLNTDITMRKKHVQHPDYIKVLEELKKSNTIYGNWVGMNLYVLIKNKIDEKKYLNQYGLYFSKKNREQNFCSGYIFEGIFLKDLGFPKEKSKKIWKDGIKNKCLGTKFEHFAIIARKNS